jgi:hypothetical protein
MSLPRYYECCICGHYHPRDWNGDCRDDAHRFTLQEIESVYGLEGEGWIVVEMP